MAVSDATKVLRQPCYREPLDNVITFRAGNARAGKIRSEPMSPQWAAGDTSPRVVTLAYPFKVAGAITDAGLTISCHRFIPHESDVMEEPWTAATGEIVKLKSSPFAAVSHQPAFLSSCRDLG